MEVVCGLDSLRPGCGGEVLHIQGSGGLVKRLKDFGFVPGTWVKCLYAGPGGRVKAIACRGSVIALRKCDVCKIQVQCDG